MTSSTPLPGNLGAYVTGCGGGFLWLPASGAQHAAPQCRRAMMPARIVPRLLASHASQRGIREIPCETLRHCLHVAWRDRGVPRPSDRICACEIGEVVPTIAQPAAIASSRATDTFVPRILAYTNISLIPRIVATSGTVASPQSLQIPSSPARFRSSSICPRSGPPPPMTNRTRDRTGSGVISNARWNASIAVSMPFSGARRLFMHTRMASAGYARFRPSRRNFVA